MKPSQSLAPQLRGSQNAPVACDQLAVLGDEARHGPAELGHAGGDPGHLLGPVQLRVPGIGLQGRKRPVLDPLGGEGEGHEGDPVRKVGQHAPDRAERRGGLRRWLPAGPRSWTLTGFRGPGYPPRRRASKSLLLRDYQPIRGWTPAGVASQKIGPDTGDMPRFARRHAFQPERNRKTVV
jgi:hypothetical protein